MATHLKKIQLLAVACLALLATLYLWDTGAAGQKEVKLPKVVSKAKSIEVVNVKIEGEHSLVVTVRNNTDNSVVAITLETGNANDGDGVTAAGYKENDEPDSIIIKPHETYDMDMPLSYLRPDGLVKVSGVIFTDETAEGEKGTIEMMRQHKRDVKSKHYRQEKVNSND